MLNERRVYPRVRIDKDCNIHPVVLGGDFIATLHDVSEGGMCLVINSPESKNIPIGSCIRFAFVDEFPYMDAIRTAMLTGLVTVIRIDGQYFGCQLQEPNKSYENYINQKKGHKVKTSFWKWGKK